MQDLYTVGNYKISVDRAASDTVMKNLPVADINYVENFAVKVDEPTEAVITYTATEGLKTSEELRFGSTDVKNVYQNSLAVQPGPVPAAFANGKQVMVERKGVYVYSGTSSELNVLSGELPVTVRIVIKTPTNNLVTMQLIQDAVARTIGGLFDNSSVTYQRVSDIVKGALIPTGL